MLILWLTALSAAGVAIAAPSSSALPDLSSPLGPVVNLGYAAYIGNTTSPTGEVNGPVTFFGGIPYAQAPLGNLRFRAPQLLDESVRSDVIPTDARDWGAPCIPEPAEVGVGSEGMSQRS